MGKLTMYRDECRHFNGIGLGGQAKRCDAGVDYRALVGGPALGWACRIPCLDEPTAVRCDRRELLTQAEHTERHAKMDAAVTAALARLGAGNCPTCGKTIEPSAVVGRCRYGACGHRIGQVLQPDEE